VSVIRSMTGYGRKEVTGAGIHGSIEVRSVNNRYLDIQVKTPRSFAALEPRLKKMVQDRFSRGRFDVFISRNGEQERTGRLVHDAALAAQYIGILRDLKERFSLSGEVDLSLVAGFQGLIAVTEEKEDVEALWLLLAEGLAQALDELDGMRGVEGQALVKDMFRRLDILTSLMKAIQKLSPLSVESARKRMAETLTRLLNEQPDPVRLAQEIAILAERTDVTEELTRLSSHLSQFHTMLVGATGEPVGRKLDFLLQEMGREANTISSKAMDAQISYHVVDMKAELEKIREQVQNIE
jgi:uncharacterized protein (TIGR00255 family)